MATRSATTHHVQMTHDPQLLKKLITEIEQQEAALVFRTFNNADAWHLGCALVARAEADHAPVVVDIQRGEQRLGADAG